MSRSISKPKMIIVSMVLLYLLIVPAADFAGADWVAIKQRYPLFPLILTGTFLVLVGIVQLVFRKELGRTNAESKREMARRHPKWKKLSGKTDEELERYFTAEYNERLTVIGAVLLLVVGIALTIVGLAV